MAVFKCTALFQQVTNPSGASQGNREGGWSESLYKETGDESAMRIAFEELCRRRALLLGASASIIGQRYQKVDPVGRANVGSRRFPGRSVWSVDVPQLALTFVMFSTTQINSRRFTLRGVPDTICAEGEYKPPAAFTTAFKDYCTQLGLFNFRARLMTAPKAEIISISDVGAVLVASDLTVTPGQQVWISGVEAQFITVPSGYHFVATATDARHFTLTKWDHGASTGGTAETSTTIYPVMETIGTNAPSAKIVVRKVGRPFGGYRGRASKRA